MISFIVPVYNTSREDLFRCANSLLAQTNSNWECIFVNNGESEETRKTLLDLHNSDCRFIILQADQKGISHARNLGVSVARGDFIAFCDSDDTYESEFIQKALAYAREHSLDVLIGGTTEFSDSEAVQRYTCQDSGIQVYEKNEIYLLLDYALASYSRTTNRSLGDLLIARVYPKLIKSQIAKKILFREDINIHEDNLWCFDLFSTCQKIGVTGECFYNYYVNPYSVTHRKATECYLQQEICFSEAVRAFCKGKPQLENARTMRLLMIANNMLNIIAKLGLEPTQRNLYLKEIIRFHGEQRVNKLVNCYQIGNKLKLLALILTVRSERLKFWLLKQLLYYKIKRS